LKPKKERKKIATKTKFENTQTITPSIKTKFTINIIGLVRYLGWVFETQETNQVRPLVVTTISIPQSNPKIQIHPLQNNTHVSKVHSGIAFVPGASGLPYYCTSICVRSCCVWRANRVDSKPKKKN